MCDLSPSDVGYKNSWSNSLQEGEDDEGLTTQDAMEALLRRITRSMSREETSNLSSLSLFCISLL